LSRFDLIFIVRDERLYERDLQIAEHVLGMHAGVGDLRPKTINPSL
jgi:DNA replication licensing factor MCM5